jgi:hypothetical protein
MGVASSFARRNIRGCAPLMAIVALCMAAAQSALAGSTMPNQPPAATPVTFPQLPEIDLTPDCKQQYDYAIATNNADAAAASAIAAPLPYPASIAPAEGAAFSAGVSATLNGITTFSNSPNCDQSAIGTQSIGVGVGNTALNVTSGESIFAGNVYVGKNGTDNGNIFASQFLASQGISADGGAIFLGNPDLTTYATGINIGGGAVAGAGSGPQATTGAATAIAIGNGANASGAGSTALGFGANAAAPNTTAIGAGCDRRLWGGSGFLCRRYVDSSR